MKTVNCLNDLRQFGIIPLTGEACALGMRCLCDLTAQGVAIVRECYSLQNGAFAENWNSGDDSNPHIASIMLGYSSWQDIGVFALLNAGYHTVVRTKNGALFGLEATEDVVWEWTDQPEDTDLWKGEYQYHRSAFPVVMTWPTCYGTIDRIFRLRTSNSDIVVGTRNVHQMSGRVS